MPKNTAPVYNKDTRVMDETAREANQLRDNLQTSRLRLQVLECDSKADMAAKVDEVRACI